MATRVLINAIHAKSGGGVNYLRNVLSILAADPRLDLHLVGQESLGRYLPDGCENVTFHWLPKRGMVGTTLWQEQLQVPILARRIGAQVVFSPANFSPLWGPPSVIMLRNAFAVGEMEERLTKRLYWAAVKALSKASFLRCRKAIAVSRYAGETLLAAYGRSNDPRMTVIPHGVSPIFRPPEISAREANLILAVSDIYIQKNLETLLRAMALLKPGHPAIRLEIAGRPLDPAYFARLQSLCSELDILDRVTFLGGLPAEQVAELYRRARAFVFPSLMETFGNPLLEAMASGLPVVCSRAAAMPEVAGDAALFAAPGDEKDLARQMGRLLGDEPLWAELSAKGIQRAQAFTWPKSAAATAGILVDAAPG